MQGRHEYAHHFINCLNHDSQDERILNHGLPLITQISLIFPNPCNQRNPCESVVYNRCKIR